MSDRDTPPAALAARFLRACADDSDIHQHLGILWGLARQCEHVTEFGVRAGVSTTALLAAQPAEIVCFDIDPCPVIDELKTMRGRTILNCWCNDSRTITIEPTDFLHIDTEHNYACLSVELKLHAPKVRKWIAMHDTKVFGVQGDDNKDGLNMAIDELVAGGKWRVLAAWGHNHGMTVLERIADE